MECVRLRVQTVPAFDPETHEAHTAYTVSWQIPVAGTLLCASGWTLKDTIVCFCKLFHLDRNIVKLTRPFLPQRMDWYDNQ